MPNLSRVLVFAPIGRDGAASADVLRRAGLRPEICASYDEVVENVESGAAAVFIAEEGLFGQDIGRLTTLVDKQPAWSDLPFIILTSKQEQTLVSAWRQRLIAALRNVSLLERPVQAMTLTSTLQAAVRARLRQYELRDLLEARERAAEQLEAVVVLRTAELEEANRELLRQIAERERIEESLRHAQKMEAIGQLTGGVAHDFNNLLMVILGGLDMLERRRDPERQAQILGGMRQAAQRGAGLTRQLLAFSRRQSLTPVPVDLAHQVGAMRDLLDRSLGGSIQVQLEFADDLWPVEVDPGELELVVLNLAVNARDAMPGGGTIRIRAENARQGDGADLPGDYVSLSVTDTGGGMPAEVRARAFEPFYTTKDVGKGSGLGLPQVYGFATQSGGSVEIRSEIGQGTTVRLLLPRSDRAPEVVGRAADQPAPADAAAGSAGCVLMVEDDDEVAALVADMLGQLGYSVTRAASGAAALGALANGRKVDLVFSDVMMPGGIDGIQLAREIRRRRPKLPVLLTSGYADPARRNAQDAGLQILGKPYDLNSLAEALAACRSDQLAS
jgi:signal transduction histidine kinase/CheY-like chemotaxis protein